MNNTKRKGEWVRVSKAEPCRVCERPDYCTRSADGLVSKCMRIESQKAAGGTGGGWIHRLEDQLPVATARPAPEKISSAEWQRRAEQMFNERKAEPKRAELAERLGVKASALSALGVGVGWDHDGREFWSFPERDAAGLPLGIKRRYADGGQRYMPGSSAGLYSVPDWHGTPGPILLPEGGSDAAALLSLGLCVIGRSSNTGSVGLLKQALRPMEGRPIIVLGENDRKPERVGTGRDAGKAEDGQPLCQRNCRGCSWCWPGKFGAMDTAGQLSHAFERDVFWRMVQGAKDSRAWLNEVGGTGRQFVVSLKVPKAWSDAVFSVEDN